MLLIYRRKPLNDNYIHKKLDKSPTAFIALWFKHFQSTNENSGPCLIALWADTILFCINIC